MQEATRLQALWSWMRGTTGGRSLAAAVLMIAMAAAALWLARHGPTDVTLPNPPGVSGTAATPDTDAVQGEAGTNVTVQGDGVAAGRDLKIEGGVNFR